MDFDDWDMGNHSLRRTDIAEEIIKYVSHFH